MTDFLALQLFANEYNLALLRCINNLQQESRRVYGVVINQMRKKCIK